MDTELLSWFGNFINFLIFTYIAISIINTQCFSNEPVAYGVTHINFYTDYINVNQKVIRR